MSSKTFKSVRSAQELTAVKTSDNNVRLILSLEDLANRTIDLAPSDAPALALAILEAAGFTEGDKIAKDVARSHFGDAVESLAVGVGEQSKATAEAKEQAELEAEARDFAKVWEPDYGDKWEGFGEMSKNRWLAVARRAREMSAEK